MSSEYDGNAMLHKSRRAYSIDQEIGFMDTAIRVARSAGHAGEACTKGRFLYLRCQRCQLWLFALDIQDGTMAAARNIYGVETTCRMTRPVRLLIRWFNERDGGIGLEKTEAAWKWVEVGVLQYETQ